MQKYKGRGCCQLNCAKVQRSWMLQSQLCKSTKVVDAAISTVQSYRDIGCCKLNCAKVQRSWMLPTQLCNHVIIDHVHIYVCGRGNYVGRNTARVTGYKYYECMYLQQLIQEQEWKSINYDINCYC